MLKKSHSQIKVALITGAAKRIGAEIARYLHQQGFNVVLHYHRSKADALELQSELNAIRKKSAMLVKADLAQSRALRQCIEKSAKYWGRLDALINNAALFFVTPLGKMDDKHWDELMDINVKAPLFLSQYAAPYLAKHKGCIVNIGDIHGMRPMRHYPVYSISKAGLLMLTKSLAKELAPNIRVNSISPGPTIWPENDNTLSKQKKKALIAKTVLQQHGDPKVVAKAVYFLVEEATTMTGQDLVLDGGRTLGI